MKILLFLMITVLLIIIAIMLFRIIKGPSSFDRLNGLGVINANVVILIVLFGFIDERPDMYIDVAIAYAILGFLGNIILGKYLERREK